MSFITGTGLTVGNANSISPVKFVLATPSVVTGQYITQGGEKKFALTRGAFSAELAAGNYKMYLGNSYVGMISVPDDDLTYSYNERLVEETYITPSTPAGGNNPNAGFEQLGLVETNSDPGSGENPVVYLKTEVDALIVGLGTAQDIGGVPTFDFSHTTIANFIFANGILNIGIAADGVTPIFSVAGTP